jgi:hypothetical protein
MWSIWGCRSPLICGLRRSLHMDSAGHQCGGDGGCGRCADVVVRVAGLDVLVVVVAAVVGGGTAVVVIIRMGGVSGAAVRWCGVRSAEVVPIGRW